MIVVPDQGFFNIYKNLSSDIAIFCYLLPERLKLEEYAFVKSRDVMIAIAMQRFKL